MLFWTNPGGSTLKNCSSMGTNLPSQKSSNLYEQDMLGTNGEVKVNSQAMFYGLLHMDTPVFTDQQRYQLCTDIGCGHEDLSEGMDDRYEGWEIESIDFVPSEQLDDNYLQLMMCTNLKSHSNFKKKNICLQNSVGFPSKNIGLHRK